MGEISNTTMQTPIEVVLGIDENGMTTAKRLYEFLELRQGDYSRWVKINIVENEFAEKDIDYWVLRNDAENPLGGRPTQDFKLTAHFAKKLSCKGSGEKAELAREYFAMVEEKAKEFVINRTMLSPQMQMFYAIADGQAKMELEQQRQAEQLNRIEQNQNAIAETFKAVSDTEEFKSWVNKCIVKIAESQKYSNGLSRSARYQKARSESYDRLNQKRACRLTQRVAYAKEIALQNGATKTVAGNINRLTVIASDKDLRPIYETVIREMMIAYCMEVA